MLTRQNTEESVLFTEIAPFRRTRPGAAGSVDEMGPLAYKPRQLSAMARFYGGRLIGAANGRFGPASITGRLLNSTADRPVGRIAMSAEIDP